MKANDLQKIGLKQIELNMKTIDVINTNPEDLQAFIHKGAEAFIRAIRRIYGDGTKSAH